ncbi:hypothetical protein [Glutamicibacter protophormiae]|uniref:hypothetical protein n=1 Tax=Glutamicibacter protophormiae TaxID=37930 RepID=UPI00332EB891
MASATEQDSAEKVVTADVQKIAKDVSEYVVKATETEPGRFSVETSIVDPRGADGSMPALQAVRLCNLVTQNFDAKYVSILEDDGTTFAVYGSPMVNGGECGEY